MRRSKRARMSSRHPPDGGRARYAVQLPDAVPDVSRRVARQMRIAQERRLTAPAPLSMGDFLRGADGLAGFPGAGVAQSAPLHEPERRQAPSFGGMGGGRALQISAAHEGGGTGRGDSPDVEVFSLGHSGTIVSLWHFCISCRPASWYSVQSGRYRRPIRRCLVAVHRIEANKCPTVGRLQSSATCAPSTQLHCPHDSRHHHNDIHWNRRPLRGVASY